MNQKNIGLIVNILAISLLAGVTLVSAAPGQEPIKIGITVAQSPPGSLIQGQEVTRGLEIARDLLNTQGEVLGRPIELLYEDTQGLPERGRAAIERLITRDNVVAVTGEHHSSVALAAVEVAHRYGVPYINTNAWADAVRKLQYPEVFNPSPFNNRVAEAIAQFIKGMGYKSIVGFAENTDYGIGLAEATGNALKSIAPGVKYRYQVLDRNARDFSSVIFPLRSNPPDLITTFINPPAGYLLFNQLYEYGVAPSSRTLVMDGASVSDFPDFWDNVHDAGLGMIAVAFYHSKMNLSPFGKQVRAEYEKRYNVGPSRLAFQAADSVLLVAEAIKKAGTTNRQAVIDALKNINIVGTRGPISFSSEPGIYYQQWKDVPYVIYQFTKVGMAPGKTDLLMGPGINLDSSKVIHPNK